MTNSLYDTLILIHERRDIIAAEIPKQLHKMDIDKLQAVINELDWALELLDAVDAKAEQLKGTDIPPTTSYELNMVDRDRAFEHYMLRTQVKSLVAVAERFYHDKRNASSL